MITTTLKKIRKHRPCGLERGSNKGYDLLRKNLGKDYGDDTPIKFSQIIESNGLNDALWCLNSICPEHEKEMRLFAADCAERVVHLYENQYPDDDRVRYSIKAARDFAEGKITEDELKVVMIVTWDVVSAAAADAAWAARAARAAAAADAAWAARAAADAAWAARAAADAAAEIKIQEEMLIKRFS